MGCGGCLAALVFLGIGAALIALGAGVLGVLVWLATGAAAGFSRYAAEPEWRTARTSSYYSPAPHGLYDSVGGAHGLGLFVISTVVFTAAGALLLHAEDRTLGEGIVSAAVLGVFFLIAASLFSDRFHDLLLLLLGCAVVYGPAVLFLMTLAPKWYLLHILCFSLHCIWRASVYRAEYRGGGMIFQDYLLCLSLSVILWLSLGRIPGLPGTESVRVADGEGMLMLQSLWQAVGAPGGVDTSLLNLRLGSGLVVLVLLGITAAGKAIRDGTPQVPRAPRIAKLSPGAAVLAPFIGLFNAVATLTNAILGAIWTLSFLAAAYVVQWLREMGEVIADRLIRSGLLRGFASSIAPYAILAALYVLCGWISGRISGLLVEESVDLRAIQGAGVVFSLGAAGLALIALQRWLWGLDMTGFGENLGGAAGPVLVSIGAANAALLALVTAGWLSPAAPFHLGTTLELWAVTLAGLALTIAAAERLGRRRPPSAKQRSTAQSRW